MSDITKGIANLPDEKRLLLERYLKNAGVNLSRTIIMRQSRDTDRFPLSYAQQRLWFLHQMEPDSPVYNIPDSHYFSGPLNIPALERSLSEIVRRHEALRTTFQTIDGKPMQVIAPPAPLKLDVTDLSGLTEEEREPEAQRQATAEAQQPFDLTRGPLLRARLLKLEEEEHVLLITMHHIISDGWSMGVMGRELSILYMAYDEGGESPLEELEVQYADFAVWQREWLSGAVLEKQLGYWRGQLGGELPVLELPTDRARPVVQTYRGGVEAFELSREVSARLKEISREAGATLFMTLLAAFKVLLYRYTGQTDICVGTPIANRNRMETEELIGFLVNTLVLRTDLSGNVTFRKLLARTRETTLGAYAHQDLPFEKLVEELQPERSTSHTPLFQVMMVLQNMPGEEQQLEGLEVERIEAETETAKFDLTLFTQETGDGLFCWFQYKTDIFEAATIERLASHFQTLLQSIAKNAEQRIAALPLMSADERTRLLVDWNNTARPYPEHACIQQLFEEQVEHTPDAVALVFKGQTLTYAALNERANQLAHYLRRAYGVAPDTLVGISIERSFEMVVGLLAILKAGGAYLPLDAANPPQRLRHMAGEAGVRVALTDERGRAALEKAGVGEAGVALVGMDAAHQDWNGEETHNPSHRTDAEHLAYVTYTSGSTGEPKGVAVVHRGVARLVKGNTYATFGEEEVFLQYAPLAFDASTLEVWGSLLNGGRLVLMPPGVASSDELGAVVEREGVTALWLTTGLFYVMVEEQMRVLRGVRRVMTGGEVMNVGVFNRFVKEAGDGVRLVHAYGPTEGTTFTTCYEIAGGGWTDESKSVSIGRPIANTQVYVLDKEMEPVVIGGLGELYIGGAGLARGYYGRREWTAERFVPSPYGTSGGERLYRTGDIVRYRSDGDIEFVGRSDEQVKVRGFRIELGEIEAVLSAHAQIKACVVVVREERAGDKRLVAYVVAHEKQLAGDELRRHLQQSLPDYMLPSAFVMLEALPLTPNGKVDRRALPAPEQSGDGGEDFLPPQTPVEEIVAGIWSEVLGVNRIGSGHNFFELGGHSLLATQVMSRVRRAFHLELPLRAIFEHPTLMGLSAQIENQFRQDHSIPAPRAVPVSRKQSLPLSFAQQRLWFIDQLEPGSFAYNIPTALRLTGQLDIAVLAATLNEIVRRHEVLRTTFAVEAGEPVQIIHDAQPVELPVCDLSGMPQEERDERAEQLLTEEVQRSFDLAAGPLLRAGVLRLAADDHVVMLTMHHIVSDGWSMSIFMREMSALYEAYLAGRPSPLKELPIQYKDFAVLQRDWLRGEVLEEQLAYWRRQLTGAPAALELPTDRPRPKQQGHDGEQFEFVVQREVAQALNALCRREGVTLFMMLLAAWQVLLARYSGQDDISVGTPIANRNRGETEDLIGFFVNTLVMRTDLSGDPSFRELLMRVRENALGAYAHQDIPFEKLVEELQPERSLSLTPLFQVMLILQNTPHEEFELSGLTVSGLQGDEVLAKFDLTLTMQESANDLYARLIYDADLFDASTIERMAGHFEKLLESIVANPDQHIARIPLLPEEERQQLLVEWNDNGRAFDASRVMHQLVEQQVERTPEKIALRFGDEQLTYRELNRRANQFARHLEGLGVGPEVLVGVLVERSVELVVALLGILKAGGAYVPIDPAYPQERIAFMLNDADVSIIVSQNRFIDRLPVHRANVVRLDAIGDALAKESDENLQRPVAARQLAYIIYTSGSTGKPKGVAIEHRSAIAFLAWATAFYRQEVFSGVLASTSICFDLSIFELFAPLSCGGKILLVENALHLPGMPGAEEVTLLNAVPSVVAELVRMQAIPQSVRVVNLPGEAFQNQLAQSIYEQAPVEKIFNLYGPSEDTTYSTISPVEQGAQRQPTIGRAINNTQLYVLDKLMQPVPVGVAGEVYIGGAGHARGYLYRPALTAEKFIPDPFSVEAGRRLYRTGDLARYLPDGDLEFLGRVDNQVKARGFRIELGEIETVLHEHAGVAEAVVVAREDVPGEKRVVAYVVPATETEFSGGELRDYLRGKLPEYMIPTLFVRLDAMPRTAHGKVDRRALPAPEHDAAAAGAAYVAPRTALEEMVAGIWGEILGIPQVGVESNFFDLGGHSLLATRVMSQLRDRGGIDVPLRVLFETPTVAGLARYAATVQPKESDMGRLSMMLEKLENISEEEVRALLALTESEHKA